MQISQLASQRNELWFEIKKGVLTSKGHDFSFTLEIRTEKTEYEYSDLYVIPRWKKKYYETYPIPSFVNNLSRLYPNVTYEKQYVCFKDSRDKEKKCGYSRSEVIKGYKITIHVTEDFSNRIYSELYSQIALPFCDKLLHTHNALLNNIRMSTNSIKIIETKHLTGAKDTFFVNTEGLWRYEPYSYSTNKYEDNIGNRFSNFGMVNLANVAECYGMALALIEVNMHEWSKCGKVNVEIFEARTATDCIGVSYWVTREAPILRTW